MGPRIRSMFPLGTFLLALAASLAACSAADFPNDPSDGGLTVDATPGAPDANLATGPTKLPFPVDDWFAPSGYMGDGASPGAIKDNPVCLNPRPSDWVGHCHQFVWTPATGTSAAGWAGVFWQYPDGNWGTGSQAGLTIPAGATKVTFQAWGATGTEKVTFLTGMKPVDGFESKLAAVALTTTPTEYTLDLSSSTYGRVIGGFAWTAEMSTVPVTFNVDDIRWQ
jgi:hypothetical protein